MYCEHCGAELENGAKFCGSCGARVGQNPSGAARPADEHFISETKPISAPAQPTYYGQPFTPAPVKVRTPGKGFAIASMVLGIIAILSLSDFYFSVGEFVFPLLALVFGFVARTSGYKQGLSTIGIVLGGVAAVIWLITLVLFLIMPDWYAEYMRFGIYAYIPDVRAQVTRCVGGWLFH